MKGFPRKPKRSPLLYFNKEIVSCVTGFFSCYVERTWVIETQLAPWKGAATPRSCPHCPLSGSNRRPTVYKTVALPTVLKGRNRCTSFRAVSYPHSAAQGAVTSGEVGSQWFPTRNTPQRPDNLDQTHGHLYRASHVRRMFLVGTTVTD